MIATYTLIETAIKNDYLKASTKNVFIYLVQRANKKLECFPGIKTIAHALKVSISTVKRAIRELVMQGFIKRIERFREGSGGQTSNLYILMQEPKPVLQEPTQCDSVSFDDLTKEKEAQDQACTPSMNIDNVSSNINTNCMLPQEYIGCQESEMAKVIRTSFSRFKKGFPSFFKWKT